MGVLGQSQWSGWEQSLFLFRIALQIVPHPEEIDHSKSRQLRAIDNHYTSMIPMNHLILSYRNEMPLDSAEPLKS